MTPVWLVTGAGSGVGRVLAAALSEAGVEVILTARDSQHLAATAQGCRGPSSAIPADLADFGAVDSLALAVNQKLAGRGLAGIVHAAGIMAWNSPATPSGWSRVPLVNALSPWRLTLALEPTLLQGPGARVLFVAGAPFTLQGIRPNLGLWQGDQPGRGMALAVEAAAAKVWMARVLGRRWAGRASAWAFHPGFVQSGLADGLPFPLKVLGRLAQPFLATRSLTGEFLALDPAPPPSGTLVAGHRAVENCPDLPNADVEEAWTSALPAPTAP